MEPVVVGVDVEQPAVPRWGPGGGGDGTISKSGRIRI